MAAVYFLKAKGLLRNRLETNQPLEKEKIKNTQMSREIIQIKNLEEKIQFREYSQQEFSSKMINWSQPKCIRKIHPLELMSHLVIKSKIRRHHHL